jgi:V8-like Glu-specific endopeptidase
MPNIKKSDSLPRPLPETALKRKFPARPPRKKALIQRTSRFFVAGGRKAPAVKTRVVAIRRKAGGKNRVDYEIVVDVKGVWADVRAVPPPVKGKMIKAGKRSDSADFEHVLTGFIPDHLAFSVRPKMRVRPFRTIRLDADPKRKVATTVFPPDDRIVFQDTAYPWSTVGLVESNRGGGSGVVIGPRHLLTVSHVIDWNAPAGFAANWVRFTPSYFDGDGPFGVTFGTHIYWYLKEDGDGFISGDESLFDYVVVVLDDRIGERTGWMGARGYDDDWDNLDVWSHMGYPSDLNSGRRPVFQGSFRLDGNDDAHQQLLHTADIFPGQSGGPMFGWWEGDVGPRAVGTQSWQNATTNGASGGMDLRDLVARARTEFA